MLLQLFMELDIVADIPLYHDMCTLVLQLLGFNCLRLPFSFVDLFTLAPIPRTWNCAEASPDDIREDVTPPCISIPNTTALAGQVRIWKECLCTLWFGSHHGSRVLKHWNCMRLQSAHAPKLVHTWPYMPTTARHGLLHLL